MVVIVLWPLYDLVHHFTTTQLSLLLGLPALTSGKKKAIPENPFIEPNIRTKQEAATEPYLPTDSPGEMNNPLMWPREEVFVPITANSVRMEVCICTSPGIIASAPVKPLLCVLPFRLNRDGHKVT